MGCKPRVVGAEGGNRGMVADTPVGGNAIMTHA